MRCRKQAEAAAAEVESTPPPHHAVLLHVRRADWAQVGRKRRPPTPLTMVTRRAAPVREPVWPVGKTLYVKFATVQADRHR